MKSILLSILFILTSPISFSQAYLLKDFFEGSSSSRPTILSKFQGKLFILADHKDYGRELWISDGTYSGTRLLKDINPGEGSSIIQITHQFFELNSKLYFIADDGVHGRELWESDGTENGTKMVIDINQNAESSLDPFSLVLVENELTFIANDGSSGEQLWISDGTALGTRRLTDLSLDNGEKVFKVIDKLNGLYIFQYIDNTHSLELWSTDGTFQNAKIVKDINPGTGSSMPKYFTRMDEQLFFSAFDSLHGFELWKSDGTELGTSLVKDMVVGTESSNPEQLKVYQNQLIFKIQGTDGSDYVWKSLGDVNTTEQYLFSDKPLEIRTIYPTDLGLFFSADDGLLGDELHYATQDDSIQIVQDIRLGSEGSFRGELIQIGSFIYFSVLDNDGWSSIWQFNGTPQSATEFMHVSLYGNSRPTQLKDYNGDLVFSLNTDSLGEELYTSNQKVGIKELSNIEVNTIIYPNPSKNILKIDCEFPIAGIVCMNMEGKVLINTVYEEFENQQELDIHHLAKGIYLLKIHTSEGHSVHRKIIVE